MKLHELLLTLMDEMGGTLSGKTKIQKLCYFYSIRFRRDIGFRAHYYGPYSPRVESALDELEGIGLVDKTVERLGENSNGFEIKRYDYTINEYGRQVIDVIKDLEEKEQVKRYAETIKEIGLPSTTDISIAAKSYFILSRADMPLNSTEIRKKAREFDWDIQPDSINEAAGFLEKLDFIKRDEGTV